MSLGPCEVPGCPRNGTWREKSQRYTCFQHANGGDRHRTLRAKGGSRFPKRRNLAYQRWIRRHKCLICGRQPVDGAHVKTKGSGGDDVDNMVPLCREHHQKQEGRNKAFNQRYNIDLRAVAKEFGDRWREREAARNGDLVDAKLREMK